MKALLLTNLVRLLMGLLTPDLLVKFADQVLDFAENHVLGTESKVDDKLVLPVCQLIRETFNIPDND